MRGPVVAEFETLDAARRAKFGNDIFALVSLFSFRRREALALNGKQRVKLAVSAAFDDERGGTGLHCEVYRSVAIRFIAGLGLELEMAPDIRVVGGTIEIAAQVFSQFGFRMCVRPIRVVAPAGKFFGYKVYELQLYRGRKVNFRVEPA